MMLHRASGHTFEVIQLELADADYRVRKGAMRKLMRYQREKALQPLLALLKDKRSDVRLKAVQALGELQDRRALEPLRALLADRSSSVRERVIVVLGSLGELSMAPDLRALLSNKSQRIRQAAARALAQLRDPASLPLLLAYLPQAEEGELSYLVPALCAFDTPQVIRPLLALCDTYPRELASIAVELARLGESATPVLSHLLVDPQSSPMMRKAIAFSLHLQPREGSLAALALAFEDSDPAVRQHVVTALGRSREDGVQQVLIRALADENEGVRRNTLWALSRLAPEPSAIDPLISCLSSECRLVVEAAVRELTRLRASRAVPALLDVVCRMPGEVLSLEDALLQLSDASVVDEIVPRLSATSGESLGMLLTLLERFLDERAAAPLLALLERTQPDKVSYSMQLFILQLLSRLRTPSISESLCQLHARADGLLQREILRAVNFIEERRA